MQLIKVSAIVVFIVSTSQVEINITNKIGDGRSSTLIKGVVNILTSCYENKLHTVGLAGTLPESLFKKLSQNLIPVASVDQATRIANNANPVLPQLRYQLQIFIIGATSPEELATVLQKKVGQSIWWNEMASFIILDHSPNCMNYEDFLGIAWKLKMLHAKVMCDHPSREIYLFDYNPHINQAPLPWKRVNVTSGITLFEMKYQNSKELCTYLDFEKTKNIGRLPDSNKNNSKK